MPPRTEPAGPSVQGVSDAYARFSVLVSQGTGLSLRVVAAWCLAEGGPDDNPLNIGPGNHYGSVEGAARATVALLHQSIYSGVLGSTRASDAEQLQAIAASPWCPAALCPGYLGLLRGTYQRVSASGDPNAAVTPPAGQSSSTASSGDGELTDAQHRSDALRALVWVALVLGGVSLTWRGLGHAFGIDPGPDPITRTAKGAAKATREVAEHA